jgi:cytochrome c2
VKKLSKKTDFLKGNGIPIQNQLKDPLKFMEGNRIKLFGLDHSESISDSISVLYQLNNKVSNYMNKND